MHISPRCFLLPTVAAILAVGVGLLIYGSLQQPPQAFHGTVLELLPPPDQIRDWKVSFLHVANTPEMQKAVAEILNYDDAIFVNYSRGGVRISVYIAYWTPGKMSHRLVAGHTPDVCWTKAGWLCESGRTIDNLESETGRLQPAELRTMVQRGSKEFVVFWHLVGNRSITYKTNWRPPWYAMFKDLWEGGMQQRKEQLFVRISSNQPLDEFWRTDPVRILASNLADLSL